VAEYIRQLGQLVPFYEKILRPDDGVDPELLSYTGASEQARVLRQTIVEFREEGYKSRDIVVLSPRKHGAPSELADTGSALRLEPYPASGNTACGWTTIHAFKGLEAPVVILADFDHVSTAERADLFYIGITRALQRLVILLGPSARKEIAAMLT
jgi:superfamily I DNA/RNA helicase